MEQKHNTISTSYNDRRGCEKREVVCDINILDVWDHLTLICHWTVLKAPSWSSRRVFDPKS